MEYTVLSVIVLFLMIIVLVIQLQISNINKSIEEKWQVILVRLNNLEIKVDDLLRDKARAAKAGIKEP
jgi:hypothetical protein